MVSSSRPIVCSTKGTALKEEEVAMRRSSKLQICCAVGMFLLCSALTGAEERWSDWMFTNDASIEWRWIGHAYGPDMPPNCNFEFRNKLGGQATFKYSASYSWREGGVLDQKRGTAYEITEAE